MSDWKGWFRRPVQHLAEQFRGIRSGTLDAGFVETIRVSWPGGSAPIRQIAAISQGGGRLEIRPFDRSLVPAIVKSLTEARQNAYALDPERVCVSIPPLSVEQRAEIVRHVKKLGEEAKVAVRTVRQDIRKQLAALGRRSDRVLQELTDSSVAEIERLVTSKVGELQGEGQNKTRFS